MGYALVPDIAAVIRWLLGDDGLPEPRWSAPVHVRDQREYDAGSTDTTGDTSGDHGDPARTDAELGIGPGRPKSGQRRVCPVDG